MVVPSDPNGQQFNLPGEAPLAHTLPTFLWPGAAFVVFMENVADSSQSRVKMVNNTIECDASTYSEAVPVILNASTEQRIKAYLTASVSKRMFCFFELPASLPLAVSAGDGSPALQLSNEQSEPRWSLIVDDSYIEHMSRGLASNLVLYDTAPGEMAQAFLLDETEYADNGNACLRAVGLEELDFEPETAASYIQRVAAVPLKTVLVLPSQVNSATHFVSVTEDETLGLSIGRNYVLCYVGSSLDTTRVFNKIGQMLSMKDIILALDKEQWPLGEAATSKEINVVVQASLSGSLSCIATAQTFSRPPIAEEIAGDYATTMPQDFVPLFDESQVLGRAILIPVTVTNAAQNLSVKITTDSVNAANIQRMPLGVAPQAYVWCKHSKSLVVYPEDGAGVAVTLGVLAAPAFQYSILSNEAKQVVLARNVSFPTLAVLWSVAGFPAYYFDEVAFTITPTLPDGLDISSQNGGIKPDPVPLQLMPPADFVIKAQSKYDLLKATSTTLQLGVEEPGQCGLASIKSTEAMLSCLIHDTHNLEVEAIYVQIYLKTGDPLLLEPSTFSCLGAASDPGGGMTDFSCSQAGAGICCCWLWVDEPGVNTVYNTTRLVSGKIMTGACGLLAYQRYDVITLASGVNPLLANRETNVVSEQLFDFTVPERKDATPLAFDIKVDINYADICDPVLNGPAAEQQCKESMKTELAALLGTPEDMITITSVRPR